VGSDKVIAKMLGIYQDYAFSSWKQLDALTGNIVQGGDRFLVQQLLWPEGIHKEVPCK
jgi:hypothetical protein